MATNVDFKIEHLEPIGSYLKCLFTSSAEGVEFIVGVSNTAFAKMGISEDDKIDTLNRLVFAITDNHEITKSPYQQEYFFDSDRVEPSIDKTLDWIKRNHI